jgi:hypothetical protein
MTIENITIPFVLKGTTEREIIAAMGSQVPGTIKSVSIKPDTHQGRECCRVTITYEKHSTKTLHGSYCPSREEWTKSRNFP